MKNTEITNNMSNENTEITNNMSNENTEITNNMSNENKSTFGDLSTYNFNDDCDDYDYDYEIENSENKYSENEESEDSENPYALWYDYWDETGHHHTPYYDDMREDDEKLQLYEWEQKYWKCEKCKIVYTKQYMGRHLLTNKHCKHF